MKIAEEQGGKLLYSEKDDQHFDLMKNDLLCMGF